MKYFQVPVTLAKTNKDFVADLFVVVLLLSCHEGMPFTFRTSS